MQQAHDLVLSDSPPGRNTAGGRGATLHAIYSAAVYEYAVAGDTGASDREMLAGAFRPKSSRRTL
jgi:hypothetical protein